MMKPDYLKIVVLACLMPALSLGQTDTASLSFYKALAKKDAIYEQRLKLPTIADYEDFWRDQKNFEGQLSNEDPVGYRIYIGEKAELYRLHALSCDGSCQHGERFLMRSAFYKKQADEKTYVSIEPTKKPPIKN